MNDMVKELVDKVRATASMAGEVAGQALDNAGKKAGDVWESTKLTLKLSELGHERDALYREIGRIVHATHVNAGASTDGLDETLNALDDKIREIEDFKARIAALKKSRGCPACGCLCLREDAFCRFCGASLAASPSDEEPQA